MLEHKIHVRLLQSPRDHTINTKSKWLWSGNTTITHCRQTNGAARKNHRTRTGTKHQEDSQSKATNDLFPIKMIAKLDTNDWITKREPSTESPQTMGTTMNQQQQSHRLRMDSSLGHWEVPGGSLNAYFWYQMFTQDCVVVKTQNLFSSRGSSHGGFLTIAMYHYREAI